ncbi:unnamed protein product [Plutella xylostella]|uniref:(diamondback moth) hypothetical protein n=1 Tax=Plutella xylostella TaxID=51655 RepID=A0A8S4EPW8_PLUXY|nr:uncharacterized protein LOC119692444 [Plutella xylostella]CAG9117805.1 unnamed protein product [Plutella xylostella]
MSKFTIILCALAVCAYDSEGAATAATAATPATAATAATPATAATAATPATAATAAPVAKRETNIKDAFPSLSKIQSPEEIFKALNIPTFKPFPFLTENEIMNLKPKDGETVQAKSFSETKKVVFENGKKVVDEDAISAVTNDNGNVTSIKSEVDADADA